MPMKREERHKPGAYLSFLTCFLFTIFLTLFLVPLLSHASTSEDSCQKLILGGVVDYGSRERREEKVAMEMAIEDFCAYSSSCCPTLLVNGSQEDQIQTVLSASSIIKDNHARAIILGTESWPNVLNMAELGNKYQVPVLSLANQVPNWAGLHLQFLVNAARSQHAEMKAAAAIIRSWQWQRVNVIYEDIDSAIAGIIPYLIEAIQEAGSEISTLLPLQTFQYNISRKLESLKNKQCRVFIVHTNSIALATKIFKEAKSLGMMEEDSVWLTTTSITNQIDSLEASVISSMDGFVGIKSYFPKSGKRYENFHSRFKAKYGLQHPDEKNLEPGIFALQAYDVAWAVAIALERKSYNHSVSNVTAGKELLDSILHDNFSGLSGLFRFNFSTNMLNPAHIFEIINVVGRSYRELGFWSEGLDFSKSIDKGSNYSTSMRILGQIVWPGGPWTVPRGWEVAKSSKPLNIAVPATTTFTEFVNVRRGAEGNPIVGGYSVDVFKEIVELLPYPLHYILVPYAVPSYDSMVQAVNLEVYDAVVADTAIVANRCKYVEFSQPYADSGLQMLIHFKAKRPTKAWLFIKPFTPPLWIVIAVANIYNGFVIWFIERKENPDRYREVSIWNQIGTMFASTFNTLFSQHGPKLSVNSSRMALIVWLFAALVITASYNASLTSFLTVQQLKPTKVDIETLKKTNAKVGCEGNSFVVKYLHEGLHFNPDNIVTVNSEDDYPRKLESGEIAAAFLEVPHVKLLLSKYCNKLVTSGETLKVGGFGFAFPRSSPYLPDISQAILKLTENGTLLNLEKKMLSSHKCSSHSSKNDNDGDKVRLGVDNFWGLFLIMGLTSSISLFIYFLTRRKIQCCNNRISQESDESPAEHPPDQILIELPHHEDQEVKHDIAQENQHEIKELPPHEDNHVANVPSPQC